MCNGLRGYMPVDPNGTRWLSSSALGQGMLAVIVCLLILPEGAHVNQQPNAGFPLFLQTWSLYQLAFTFKKSVPWGRYGNPFSFSTSRDLSVVLLFFFKLRSSPASGSYHKCPAGRHSPGLCLDFNTGLLPPHLSHMKSLLTKIISRLGICATKHV